MSRLIMIYRKINIFFKIISFIDYKEHNRSCTVEKRAFYGILVGSTTSILAISISAVFGRDSSSPRLPPIAA